MVGVPGRSKGCHTCRQRSIRCKEERPNCSNCIKSKRLCGGYMQKHAFILTQEMQALESDPTKNISADGESGQVMVARWRLDPSKPSLHTRKMESAPYYRKRHVRVSTPLPCQISSTHAARQQILDFFLTNHLPLEVYKDRSSISKEQNWLLQVQDLPNLTPALESSVLAICIARLGRTQSDETLLQESLSMYTKGLHQLQQALRYPRTRLHDETVAACMALIMFESNECPSRQSGDYQSHYYGAMRLLQLRTPEAHASGIAHGILQDLRIHSIFHGMHMRSKTFLADPEWRDVPWKSSKKGLRDELVDILLDIPELFHKTDNLASKSNISERVSGLMSIVSMSWRIDSQLSDWYSSLETFVAGPVYWPELSTLESCFDDAESGKVFSVSFYFPSYTVAQSMVLYWLGILVLYQHLCDTYANLKGCLEGNEEDMECTCIQSPTSDSENIAKSASTICLRHFNKDMLPPLNHRTEWARGPARNICQSVEYLMQESMGTIGSSTILGRLAIVRLMWVLAAPGEFPREVGWTTELMVKIQTKGYWNMKNTRVFETDLLP